jgi:hypothetical protein
MSLPRNKCNFLSKSQIVELSINNCQQQTLQLIHVNKDKKIRKIKPEEPIQ